MLVQVTQNKTLCLEGVSKDIRFIIEQDLNMTTNPPTMSEDDYTYWSKYLVCLYEINHTLPIIEKYLQDKPEEKQKFQEAIDGAFALDTVETAKKKCSVVRNWYNKLRLFNYI